MKNPGRLAVIGIPYAWLLLFFLLPFFIVVGMSLAEMGEIRPKPLMALQDGVLQLRLKYADYIAIAQDSLYVSSYLRSLKYAAATTVLCLFIGYPFSYFMARARPALQPALLMLVMLPFWTSFLLRVYAWKGLLGEGGWVAELLILLHVDDLLVAIELIPAAGKFMNTPFSLVVGMVYTYLPFMVLPLYANLAKMDLRLLEAAGDLGATAWVAFWTITVPLSKAGIIAGAMLVFSPCVGEFVIPELLGPSDSLMIGKVLWGVFFSRRDWPAAGAVAISLLLLLVIPIMFLQRAQNAEAKGSHR